MPAAAGRRCRCGRARRRRARARRRRCASDAATSRPGRPKRRVQPAARAAGSSSITTPRARTRQRTVRGDSAPAVTSFSSGVDHGSTGASIRMPVSMRLDRQGAEGRSDSAPSPSPAREGPHRALVDAGLHEGVADGVVARGIQAGAVLAEVVQCWCRTGSGAGGARRDGAIQVGLAEEAAVDRVGAVGAGRRTPRRRTRPAPSPPAAARALGAAVASCGHGGRRGVVHA